MRGFRPYLFGTTTIVGATTAAWIWSRKTSTVAAKAFEKVSEDKGSDLYIRNHPHSGNKTLADIRKSTQSALRPSIRQMAQKNDFHVMKHQTPCQNIPQIMKMMALQPAATHQKSRYNYVGGPKKEVYTELTNDVTEKKRRSTWGDCTLYLSLELLNDKQDYHVSHLWRYGTKHPSFTANGQDAKQMKRITGRLRQPSGYLLQNEVVFPGKEIDLAHNLQAVKVPKENAPEVIVEVEKVFSARQQAKKHSTSSR